MTDDQIRVGILTAQRNQLADQVLELQVELQKVAAERQGLLDELSRARQPEGDGAAK